MVGKVVAGMIMEKMFSFLGGVPLALSYDDVLLVPDYAKFNPADAETKTWLTRGIELNIPVVSAAMDTVTEALMAIAMARMGGIGFIHRAMLLEAQIKMVEAVKRSTARIIRSPKTVTMNMTAATITQLIEELGFSSFPVLDGKRLVGIVTKRDVEAVRMNPEMQVSSFMTNSRILVTVDNSEIDGKECEMIMAKKRIEQILIVGRNASLIGMITKKDIEKRRRYPFASRDKNDSLLVGAAVGASEEGYERALALSEAGVDVIVIDASHGHTKSVIEAVKKIKKAKPDLQIIAGNVVTPEGVRALEKAGVDAVKIGIGPGSTCTTRQVTGAGVPQITALLECRKIANRLKIPLIADGGIRFSGDLTKAIAAGASSIMIGGLLAGTEESPGNIIKVGEKSYKILRGMGSRAAMENGSKDRYYSQEISAKAAVPQGVEGRVPYKGSVYAILPEMIEGLKHGMGLAGCSSVDELRKNGRFVRITAAGQLEGRPHDIIITQE